MALAAVLAGVLLPDGLNHPYGLIVGGVDVLREPGAAGNRFGVPIGSIVVEERGPGAVSAMSFDFDDPLATMGFVRGAEVWYVRVADNAPQFHGYIDHWDQSPAFGGQGREFHVTCTGVEAWLDWLVQLGAVTTTNALSTAGNLEQALANIPPISVVRNTTGGSYGTGGSGLAAGLGAGATGDTALGRTYPAGGTIRALIQAILDDSTYAQFGGPQAPIDVLYTVDWYLGLRVWPTSDAAQVNLKAPDDYAGLTVTDTFAGALASDKLSLSFEPDDVIHEVYVAGASAAASDMFGDGTGIRGRQAYIADSSITTYAAARARARALLRSQSNSVGGSLTIEDYAGAPGDVHAGSVLTLTDTAAGATGQYRIFGIDKTYSSAGLESWVVHFGGLPPSASSEIRRLTRSTPY